MRIPDAPQTRQPRKGDLQAVLGKKEHAFPNRRPKALHGHEFARDGVWLQGEGVARIIRVEITLIPSQFRLLAFVPCFLLGATASADDRPQISKRQVTAAKTTSPPKIDGDLSDSCWKDAPIVDKFTDSQNGSPAADQTIVKLLYDDKYIYIAYDCRDSHPEAIMARETVRDTKFQGNNNNGSFDKEENVEIDFDTFNTRADRDLSQFSVNAIGTRSAQLSGGRGSKAEWKGDWDAAVKRTTTGWTCEIRIPWASLNYPNSAAPVTMGINFYRFQDRTKIQSVWSNEGAQGFTALEGSWVGVQVPRASFRRTLSLLPYLLTSTTLRHVDTKLGLDARYTITPQLTGVGSINPDFSSVEGAVQSIQFSHSERFLPDRRPFFTEGGNFFQNGTNGNDIGAFFYPNRIQTFDVGVKVYGKIAPKDTLGFLDTNRFDKQNAMATRYSHSYSDTSQGGFMVVQDAEKGMGTNTVSAVDHHVRWGNLEFEGIGANSNGPGAGGGAEVASVWYAEKYTFSVLQFSGISNNFKAPLGFFPFSGYKGPTAVFDYGSQWRKGYWRAFDWLTVGIDWFHMDGQPFFRGAQTQFTLETRSDSYSIRPRIPS